MAHSHPSHDLTVSLSPLPSAAQVLGRGPVFRQDSQGLVSQTPVSRVNFYRPSQLPRVGCYGKGPYVEGGRERRRADREKGTIKEQ